MSVNVRGLERANKDMSMSQMLNAGIKIYRICLIALQIYYTHGTLCNKIAT